MRNLLLSAAFASCLFWLAGCEKIDQGDRVIIWGDLAITFASKETGEVILGPDRTYPPDSVRVYNQEWIEIENAVGPCSPPKPEGEHAVYIENMYKRGPATAEEFDTTYYLKFPVGDIDTIRVSYTYDKYKDFYFQLIQYNDSLYSHNTYHVNCGILLYKKDSNE